MKLLSFEASNLFSLGHVKLDLANRGLTLVTGYSYDENNPNGAGKSSLANKGIVWTLFGQIPHGLNKADGVINIHKNDTACGKVEFESHDGKIYTVQRKRKPNELLLYSGDADLSKRESKETQKLIVERLGCSFDLFVQTILFGQGKLMQYPMMRPSEQKALLESILPMDTLDQWARNAEDEATHLTSTNDHLYNKNQRLSGRIDALSGQVRRAGQSSDEWIAQKTIDLHKIANKIEDIKKNERGKIYSIEEQMKGLCSDPKVIDDLHDKILEAHRLSRAAYDRHKLYVSASNSLIEEDMSKPNKNCKRCLQPLPNQSAILIQEKKWKENKDRLRCYVRNVNISSKLYTEYKVRLKDLNAELDKCNSELDQYKYLQSELEDLKNNRVLMALEEKLSELKKARNPYLDEYNIAEKNFRETKRIQAERAQLIIDNQKQYENVKLWKDIYSNRMKVKLFQAACPFLNARAAKHMEGLGNPQINIQFNAARELADGNVKEEFGVEVWSKTGGRGFSMLSGGEQQIASFAIGLALSDLAETKINNSSSITILDEPFSMLSPKNSEALVNYLSTDLNKKYNTILLISNEEYLQNLIPNIVHVTKRGGVSVIEEA